MIRPGARGLTEWHIAGYQKTLLSSLARYLAIETTIRL